MLRQIYLSPLARPISWAMRTIAAFKKPFMVYGYLDGATGAFRKHTRVSSSAVIGDTDQVEIADHVWLAHYSIIDGSCGVSIAEGVQIGFWCGIFSHSSHVSARLLGRKYIETDRDDRVGYLRGKVSVGPFTCICTGSIILPGVTIGKGALIAGGSVVSHDVPDFGIVRGNPARLIGDTRQLDAKYRKNPEVIANYFSPEDLDEWVRTKRKMAA